MIRRPTRPTLFPYTTLFRSERVPRPGPDRSSSRPAAAVNSPLPSASIWILSPVPWALPQAPMTKASFTATQAIRSTPLARISSARITKPGRWWSLHVGVKAPGTAKSTTLPLPSTSPLSTGLRPSAVKVMSLTLGMVSPTGSATGPPEDRSVFLIMSYADRSPPNDLTGRWSMPSSFSFRLLSKDSIPDAMKKAERYRLLGEPDEAESVCLDILQVDPDNQEARVDLILAISDQFGRERRPHVGLAMKGAGQPHQEYPPRESHDVGHDAQGPDS